MKKYIAWNDPYTRKLKLSKKDPSPLDRILYLPHTQYTRVGDHPADNTDDMR